MFDVVWSGRRHVMMGGSQIDKYGNQNFAFIGSPEKPTHAAARHARRARQHDQRQDVVLDPEPHDARVRARRSTSSAASATTAPPSSGRAAAASTTSCRVVTNLCVFDFETPDHRMRLRSVHPGVTVDDVVAATGFELAIAGDVPEHAPAHRRRAARGSARSSTRTASASRKSRTRDGPAVTAHADLRSVRHRRADRADRAWAGSPGPGSSSATAEAGALGILASATMTYDQLAAAIREVQGAHRPAVRREPARRRRRRRRARRAARARAGAGRVVRARARRAPDQAR